MAFELDLRLSARVAVVSAEGNLATLADLTGDSPRNLNTQLVSTIKGSCSEQGGEVPEPCIREVVENLLHACYKDVSIIISDKGNSVSISDHGPGISDKAACMTPGFTSATAEHRRLIRGVGLGFTLARSSLREVGGELSLADNVGGGLVVQISCLPHPCGQVLEPPAQEGTRPGLDDHSKRVLLLLAEIGSGDEGTLARELRLLPAELGARVQRLRSLSLVDDDGSKLALTDLGLRALEGIFSE